MDAETDDVFTKTGYVTESRTVHLETTNCHISAVRQFFVISRTVRSTGTSVLYLQSSTSLKYYTVNHKNVTFYF